MAKRVYRLKGAFSIHCNPGIAARRANISLKVNMFPGFPPEGLQFLRALKRNNRREWFQPRKEIFETKLKAPMLNLVEAVNAELMNFAPQHVTNPKDAVYRIYRDTRFSADKTPYKTHIAAIFPQRGLTRHSSAGFYFHISPKSVAVGAGAYMPGKDELLAIRAWLAENHAEFRKASRLPANLWGELQGSALTRMPKGFVPGHPAEDLIRMKQWLYFVELDLKLAATPKLTGELVKRFRAAAPVLAMLNAPLQKTARATSPLSPF